jgi:hypothetical protein
LLTITSLAVVRGIVNKNEGVVDDCAISSGFLPVLSLVDAYGIISDEVPVAQWIERAPPECEIAGSSPVGDVLILIKSYTSTFIPKHLSKILRLL